MERMSLSNDSPGFAFQLQHHDSGITPLRFQQGLDLKARCTQNGILYGQNLTTITLWTDARPGEIILAFLFQKGSR